MDQLRRGQKITTLVRVRNSIRSGRYIPVGTRGTFIQFMGNGSVIVVAINGHRYYFSFHKEGITWERFGKKKKKRESMESIIKEMFQTFRETK